MTDGTDLSAWPPGPGGRRWVRIMCDVFADGVWNHDGEGCPADSLPISAALVARIRAWQELYNRAELEEDPIDWTAFDTEGWSIAHEVKAALPDWTVIYFDEARLRRGARICEVEII